MFNNDSHLQSPESNPPLLGKAYPRGSQLWDHQVLRLLRYTLDPTPPLNPTILEQKIP